MKLEALPVLRLGATGGRHLRSSSEWLPTAFTQFGPAGVQISIPPGYPWRDEAEECRRSSMTDPGPQPVRAWAPAGEVEV